MGIFDIFSSKPSLNAINNQVAKAKEGYAQSDYRKTAMEKLLKWNTKESLSGLLERFSVVVQSLHWDQEEKKWLVEEIINNKNEMKDVVIDFILKKNEITQCLIAIRKILDNDKEYIELLKKALSLRIPSDYRSVQSKKELINELAQFIATEDLSDLILPYLHDHSDDVQCVAIDFLIKSNNKENNKALIEVLGSETHSSRVLRNLATLISAKEIEVSDNTKLASVLKEEFSVKNNKLVRNE